MSTPEHRQGPEQHRVLHIQSNIEAVDGQRSDLTIELDSEGKARAAAFFDIDGTLAHMTFVHDSAIQRLYPDVDAEELTKVFRDGFRLGNSFREMHRMNGIYREGHVEWKDPEIYYRDGLLPQQQRIDEPGYSEHDQAVQLFREYAVASKDIVEQSYLDNPKQFEDGKIQPIFRLAQIYKRLGIPQAVMTANNQELSRAFAKYLGFSDLFIDVATDETMEGGGKEKAIEFLIKKMEEKGITVPKDRLILAGDSIRGDIGVANKLPTEWQVKVNGLVVLKDRESLKLLQRQIIDNPDIAAIASTLDVSALVVDEVPLNSQGRPTLASRYRDRFLTKLP